MTDLLANRWVRLAALAGGVALAAWLLSALKPVLTPFVLAFALAYFLNPAVNALERSFGRAIARSRLLGAWLDPRTAAVGVLAALAAGALAALALVVVPVVGEQMAETARKLPGWIQSLRSRLDPLIERLNLRYPDQLAELRRRLQEALGGHLPQLLSPLTHAFQRMFSSALGFVLALLHLVVIPVFTLYLLHDLNRIRDGIRELVPPRYREYADSRGAAVGSLLSAFARGQITVCLLLGTFYAAAFSIVSLPMSVLVGYTVAFFNLVPFMSVVLGLPLVLLLSAADQGTLAAAATVTGIFAFGHFVESHFVTPRIVGGRLGLHPVVILLAVLVGGQLFGFVGMLLAVPTTAVLSVFWSDLRGLYLRSGFYSGASPGGS